MKYQVIEPFMAKTTQSEKELQFGQIVILSLEKALDLLNKGKIIPMGSVAVRIYSEILGTCLWVVLNDGDKRSLKSRGNNDPVYTATEIRNLRGAGVEELKNIHDIKVIFPDSEVESRGPNV